jgi:hypothetical protein
VALAPLVLAAARGVGREFRRRGTGGRPDRPSVSELITG